MGKTGEDAKAPEFSRKPIVPSLFPSCLPFPFLPYPRTLFIVGRGGAFVYDGGRRHSNYCGRETYLLPRRLQGPPFPPSLPPFLLLSSIPLSFSPLVASFPLSGFGSPGGTGLGMFKSISFPPPPVTRRSPMAGGGRGCILSSCTQPPLVMEMTINSMSCGLFSASPHPSQLLLLLVLSVVTHLPSRATSSPRAPPPTHVPTTGIFHVVCPKRPLLLPPHSLESNQGGRRCPFPPVSSVLTPACHPPFFLLSPLPSL